MESIIELDQLQLAHHRAFNDVPEYEGAAKPKHFMGVLHFRQIIYPTLALAIAVALALCTSHKAALKLRLLL